MFGDITSLYLAVVAVHFELFTRTLGSGGDQLLYRSQEVTAVKGHAKRSVSTAASERLIALGSEFLSGIAEGLPLALGATSVLQLPVTMEWCADGDNDMRACKRSNSKRMAIDRSFFFYILFWIEALTDRKN